MIETLQILKPILADIFGTEEEDITPAVTFDELGADYEDMVEILMTVEEEFDVLIDDDAISTTLNTVSDLIACIKELRND